MIDAPPVESAEAIRGHLEAASIETDDVDITLRDDSNPTLIDIRGKDGQPINFSERVYRATYTPENRRQQYMRLAQAFFRSGGQMLVHNDQVERCDLKDGIPPFDNIATMPPHFDTDAYSLLLMHRQAGSTRATPSYTVKAQAFLQALATELWKEVDRIIQEEAEPVSRDIWNNYLGHAVKHYQEGVGAVINQTPLNFRQALLHDLHRTKTSLINNRAMTFCANEGISREALDEHFFQYYLIRKLVFEGGQNIQMEKFSNKNMYPLIAAFVEQKQDEVTSIPWESCEVPTTLILFQFLLNHFRLVKDIPETVDPGLRRQLILFQDHEVRT